MYQAGHTEKLLKNYPNIDLVSVDTVRPPEVDALLERYPNFTFIQDMSLNVIPSLGGLDVVLLDGDHNYYTVRTELENLWTHQDVFPLVILHDVDGPWGRLDLYYNEGNIPSGWLRPERQGVLSAVEDFIVDHKSPGDEYYFELTLHTLGPGLGVLEVRDGAGI